MPEPIKCGRMGPVARACATAYAEAWGLEAVPVCSKCGLPVNAGATRLAEIQDGTTLICTICTGDHVPPNYENRYERRRQADEQTTARQRGDQGVCSECGAPTEFKGRVRCYECGSLYDPPEVVAAGQAMVESMTDDEVFQAMCNDDFQAVHEWIRRQGGSR